MITRRQFLQGFGATLICLPSPSSLFAENTSLENITQSRDLFKKIIPSSQEALCSIGMGTWQTFNVGSDPQLRAQRTQLVDLFFKLGGQMIDSSPMYGSSQQVVGQALQQLNQAEHVFSSEKIWTSDRSATRSQIEETAKDWQVSSFDLLQVHNLLRWEQHLTVLKEMKKNGEVRYIGVTTSHGRRHKDLEKIMLSEPLDFVQLTYNIEDREVESRLLPLALEKGIAVIVNRPFQGGYLMDRLQKAKHVLPDWAPSIDCHNWAQFLLKFIISHPAVTCAIPATTKPEHLRENMSAASGIMPSLKQRQAMLSYFQTL